MSFNCIFDNVYYVSVALKNNNINYDKLKINFRAQYALIIKYFIRPNYFINKSQGLNNRAIIARKF